MNLWQLEYIAAIGTYGNVSEAAAHLGVTPSAVNQQLLKLEKQLELPLFVRTYHRLEPTAAGRLYLQSVQEILEIRQRTYSILKDMAGLYMGEYSIGIVFDHGGEAIRYAYPLFSKRYPNISLRCREGMVDWQLELIQKGELDLGFVLLSGPPLTDDCYVHLSEENLLLGMPASHRLAHLAAEPGEELATIDLTRLQDDFFALSPRGTTMRQSIDGLFARAGYHPHLAVEAAHNRLLEQLAAQQVCCTILPQTYATDQQNLVWFKLPGRPRFGFYAVYRHGTRLNHAMNDLVEFMKEYAQSHFQFD